MVPILEAAFIMCSRSAKGAKFKRIRETSEYPADTPKFRYKNSKENFNAQVRKFSSALSLLH